MIRFKKFAKILVTLLIVIGISIGFKIAHKKYSAHQDMKSLEGTVLGIELTPSELEQGKRLKEGEILYKKPIDLAKIEPLWRKISENGKLKDDFSYLNKIDFFSIVYKSDSLLINGFIIEPKIGGKFPVVIFNRGGNKKIGKESRMSTLFSLLYSSAKLATEGYVIIASCYRENDEFGGRDINDVLNLIKTAKYIPKGDTERLGMFGWSRGGIMTYLSLKNSDLIKTAVVVNGPTDLSPLIMERPEMETVCYNLIPNYTQNKKEELEKRSVVYWAEDLDKSASLLIVCGEEDEQVNPNQSHKIADRLGALNYNYAFRSFKTDHKFTGEIDELNNLLINWFGQKL